VAERGVGQSWPVVVAVVAVGLREDWEEDSGGCRCVWPEEERSRCGAVGWRSWVCWGKMALLHGEGPSLLEEEETKGQRESGRSLFLTEGKGATATGFLLAEGK